MATMGPRPRHFDLHKTLDVVQARQCAREMARDLGFGLSDQARIATAVSEVAGRALKGRGRRSVRFAVVALGPSTGLECVCTGGQAVKEPSAAEGRGVLGGIESLVDEFLLEAGDGESLVVVMRKWLR